MIPILTGMLDAALSVGILASIVGGQFSKNKAEQEQFLEDENYAVQSATQQATEHVAKPERVKFTSSGNEYEEELPYEGY